MLGLAAGSAVSVVVSQSLLGCAAGEVTDPDDPSNPSTSCVLTAALTEGPYFVDEKLFRSDIRADPVTGGNEWGIVKAPDGGIMGVYSLSDGRPLKISGFRPRDKELEGAVSYTDWKFVITPALPTPPKPVPKPPAAP
jgi:hypothetical protein